MARTTIEWTETSWNPVTGCSKVSTGCKHCYAERMARRLKAMGQRNYVNGFDVTLHDHMLEVPLGWTRPRMVFVNSMSDLFHEDVPASFIMKVFTVIGRAHRHTFQILTKRAQRLATLGPSIEWPTNVWMGVSVENARYTGRIAHLKKCGASVKFLSLEPLLGSIPHLELDGIDWVIVGGESGPGARPMKEPWVLQIRDQCSRSGTPFFFKQWGGRNKKRAGRCLQGRTWNEMPLHP